MTWVLLGLLAYINIGIALHAVCERHRANASNVRVSDSGHVAISMSRDWSGLSYALTIYAWPIIVVLGVYDWIRCEVLS